MSTPTLRPCMTVFDTTVIPERWSQLRRWGVQRLPDGTGALEYAYRREWARDACDAATAKGEVTWRHVLLEEVYEALAEDEPGRLEAELAQVAAVTLAWLEDIDSRSGDRAPLPAEGGGV